jgi:hypothetical protein
MKATVRTIPNRKESVLFFFDSWTERRRETRREKEKKREEKNRERATDK